MAIMLLATLGAWASWIVVLMSIDPTRSGALGFVFFYLTFALAIFGTLAIVGAGIRIWMKREILISRHVWKAFRQGLLLSALVIVSLLLLPAGLFSWWTGMLLVAMLALVELAWMSSGRPKHSGKDSS